LNNFDYKSYHCKYIAEIILWIIPVPTFFDRDRIIMHIYLYTHNILKNHLAGVGIKLKRRDVQAENV